MVYNLVALGKIQPKEDIKKFEIAIVQHFPKTCHIIMTKRIDSLKPALLKYTTELISDYIVETFNQSEYQLVISPHRSSKLGDYSPPFRNRTYHRISVNGNLNSYSFFITFLHELAHFQCWQKHQNKVKTHGQEWKSMYAFLLRNAMVQNLFPADIIEALETHLTKIKSSTTYDYQLIKVLKIHDECESDEGQKEVGDLNCGDVFEFKGKTFKFEKIMRKRALCLLMPGSRKYSFSPFVRVNILNVEN